MLPQLWEVSCITCFTDKSPTFVLKISVPFTPLRWDSLAEPGAMAPEPALLGYGPSRPARSPVLARGEGGPSLAEDGPSSPLTFPRVPSSPLNKMA